MDWYYFKFNFFDMHLNSLQRSSLHAQKTAVAQFPALIYPHYHVASVGTLTCHINMIQTSNIFSQSHYHIECICQVLNLGHHCNKCTNLSLDHIQTDLIIPMLLFQLSLWRNIFLFWILVGCTKYYSSTIASFNISTLLWSQCCYLNMTH